MSSERPKPSKQVMRRARPSLPASHTGVLLSSEDWNGQTTKAFRSIHPVFWKLCTGCQQALGVLSLGRMDPAPQEAVRTAT